MKLLVTGSKGQLATAIAHSTLNQYQTQFLSHHDLDIGDKQAVKSAVAHFSPDVIINTAAFTAVDVAEKNPQQAFYANEKAVFALASVCSKENIPLIHFSTDYVFDGKKTLPYVETDLANPINVYGLSKYRGEEAIREVCEAYIILRVSSVFSMYGNNFVKTILKLAQQKTALNVVADQWHCPTSADSIVGVLDEILRNMSDKKWGTYHYCGASPITWYGFCEKILQLSSVYGVVKMPALQAVNSTEFAAAALRPSYSVLSCDKIAQNFGVSQSSWLDDLEQVVCALVAGTP